MQTGSSELVKKQEVNYREEWLTLCTWDLGTLSRRLWESAEGFKQGQQLYARSTTLAETDWLGGLRAKACPEVMEAMGQKMMATSKMTKLGLRS